MESRYGYPGTNLTYLGTDSLRNARMGTMSRQASGDRSKRATGGSLCGLLSAWKGICLEESRYSLVVSDDGVGSVTSRAVRLQFPRIQNWLNLFSCNCTTLRSANDSS